MASSKIVGLSSAQKPLVNTANSIGKNKSDAPPPVDLNNRNPHDIAVATVELDFTHVFIEPDSGVHSHNAIWEISYTVYYFVKLWTYRILTLLFGIPLAIIWGICFGTCSCFSIWCIVPSLRFFLLPFKSLRIIFEACAASCFSPFMRSASLIFNSIRVHNTTDTPPPLPRTPTLPKITCTDYSNMNLSNNNNNNKDNFYNNARRNSSPSASNPNSRDNSQTNVNTGELNVFLAALSRAAEGIPPSNGRGGSPLTNPGFGRLPLFVKY